MAKQSATKTPGHAQGMNHGLFRGPSGTLRLLTIVVTDTDATPFAAGIDVGLTEQLVVGAAATKHDRFTMAENLNNGVTTMSFTYDAV